MGKDAVLKVTAFDRMVNDLIQWNWWDFFPMQPQNIGRVHIRGYETEASYHVADAASLSLNYTYTNPIDELTGQKIYQTIPKQQTKAVLTLFPVKDLYVTMEGRAVDNYVQQNTWRYSVMDAKIAEKLGLDPAELQACASTTVTRQAATAPSVLSEDPALYLDIQRLNPPREEVYRATHEALDELVALVAAEDVEGFRRVLTQARTAVANES